MKLNIITEPFYHQSYWYKEIIRGIHSSAKKNIEPCFFQPEDESFRIIAENEKTALILAASRSFIDEALNKCHEHNIYSICLHKSSVDIGFPYCVIMQDYYHVSYQIADFLAKKHKSFCFFALNLDSFSDRMKYKGMNDALLENNIEKCDIFYNNGDIQQSIDDFCRSTEDYDCVFCANDIVAVLLSKAADIKAQLVSYGNMLCLKNAIPDAIRITLDFFEAGSKISEIYEYIVKSKSQTTMSLTLKNKIYMNGSSLSEPEKYGYVKRKETVEFYNDPLIIKINKLELLYNSINEFDENILKCLCSGKTYEKTAELCNTAVSSIKYRLNRLIDICSFEDKKELLDTYNMIQAP